MDDSNNATLPRPTLKLKAGARKPQADIKPQANIEPRPDARPHDKAKLKAGARWSEDYLNKMQADMDGLRSRR
jgi:hypothetical protein